MRYIFGKIKKINKFTLSKLKLKTKKKNILEIGHVLLVYADIDFI